MQPSLFTQPEALSVTDLTRYIRDVFELDYRLQDVWVQGEISNLSRPSSGHVYFSLKDSGASIRCVMWKTAAATQASKLREGDAIIAHGKISVYEPQGAYQLYVDAVQAAGAGDLFQQFELLKAKLQAEGLFDLDRKRPLPEAAHTIGIVTSPTGAALQDMLNIIRRRWPLMKIVLASTPVQGDDAPVKIIAALKQLYRRTDLDAIIVARGGGSIEDLWAFNDENVARTIVQSPVPVISGVGHEVDFTIADFVADVRAPTPSAAAELITPDQAETRSMLQSYSYTMTSLLTSRLQNDRMILNSQVRALQHLSPRVKLSNARQRIDDLLASLQESMAHDLELQREKISSLSAQLSALNPLNVLARGYAVVRIEPSGQIVRSRKQIKPQQPLSIRVRDGEFDATSKG
ncbi:MAG TPA: exodeoxyribonuclease VII large subunit [Anaerolineae bacterium]|nr:exodeoxyribonuclease VII large subunit [Anaerolineae bacterium]